ncbi:hypothetical protein MnTg04_01602 [bacterium MnTg04]|nr:hypothetical protein MnTg04_01602 [bacterium MnTg04]
MGGIERQPRRSSLPRPLQSLLQRDMGAAQNIAGPLTTHKMIGLGQKLPFRVQSRPAESVHQRFHSASEIFLDVLLQRFFGDQRVQQFHDCPALDNRETAHHHITLNECPEEVFSRHPGCKQVFTGLDPGRSARDACRQRKGPRATKYFSLRQLPNQASQAQSGADQ